MRRTFLPLVTALLCLLATPLHAHEERRSNLEVVIDRVAPQPAGLEVRVVDTLAPQMVVSNRTGKTLEILDAHGNPVIRIGTDRTWVNASAPAYYSEHPMGDSTTTAASKGPRWVVASRQPSWGWFDRRSIARAIRARCIEYPARSWSIVRRRRWKAKPARRSAARAPIASRSGSSDWRRREPFLRIGSDGGQERVIEEIFL